MHELIIFGAKYLALISIVIAGIYWLTLPVSGKKSFAINVVAGGLLALILSRLAGHLYTDPRPFVVSHSVPLVPHVADNGFPSDHALLTSFIAYVVLLKNRMLGAVLFVIAVSVGAARVGAGVHHPIDIVGSFIIAAIATLLVAIAGRYLVGRKTA